MKPSFFQSLQQSLLSLLGAAPAKRGGSRNPRHQAQKAAEQKRGLLLGFLLCLLLAGGYFWFIKPLSSQDATVFYGGKISHAEAQSLYAQAVVAQETGNYAQATDLFQRVEEPYRGLEPFISLHLAQVFEKTGCESCLQLRLKRAVEAPLPPALKAHILLKLSKSHLRAKEYDKAIATLETLTAAPLEQENAKEGLYFLGQALLDQSQLQAGRPSSDAQGLPLSIPPLPASTQTVWWHYLELYPQGPEAAVIAHNLQAYFTASGRTLSATQRAYCLRAYAQQGQWKEALALAGQPYDAAVAAPHLVRAALEAGETTTALEQFIRLAPSLAETPKEANGLAQALLSKLPNKEAKQAWVARLQGRGNVAILKLWLEALVDESKTAENAAALVKLNPLHRFAPFAQSQQVRLALAKGDAATALAAAETYEALTTQHNVKGSPWVDSLHRPAVLFWKAVAEKQLKRYEAAKTDFNAVLKLYPSTYYALRSHLHLQAGLEAASFVPLWQQGQQVSLPLLPSTFEQGKQWLSELKQRGETTLSPKALAQLGEFLELKAYDDAERLIQLETQPASEEQTLLLAWLESNQEQPYLAIKRLRDWQSDLDRIDTTLAPATTNETVAETPTASNRFQTSPLFLELAYPLLYATQYQAAAHESSVPPLMLLALSRQESSFNTAAQSPVGAVGLMQLLPSTASQVAKRKVPPTDLLDADQNIRYGGAYVQWLHSQLQGDPLLVVASYNAGLGNVAKWVNADPQRYKTCPDCFVEAIPFDETRHYVEHVFAGWWVYQQRYAPAS